MVPWPARVSTTSTMFERCGFLMRAVVGDGERAKVSERQRACTIYVLVCASGWLAVCWLWGGHVGEDGRGCEAVRAQWRRIVAVEE